MEHRSSCKFFVSFVSFVVKYNRIEFNYGNTTFSTT